MKKTKQFNMEKFIVLLTAISERQGANETRAARLIIKQLFERNIPFVLQKFTTSIPLVKKSKLQFDGKNIPAYPTAIRGGEINNKNSLISSLISSQKNITDANINFNPQSVGISRSNHYFAPSFAISMVELPSLLKAKKVQGVVQVKPMCHESQNILVGNLSNPTNIIFCHYDSFGPGAIDNASGTALLLELIINYPETLEDTLYVIAGNEEISYDFPVYWGHGYRVFEKKCLSILEKCKKIFVVDCVGNGRPVFDNVSPTVKLAFPIKNLEKYKQKIYAVYGDAAKLMEVYHSDLDVSDLVEEKYLQQTLEKMLRFLK